MKKGRGTHSNFKCSEQQKCLYYDFPSLSLSFFPSLSLSLFLWRTHEKLLCTIILSLRSPLLDVAENQWSCKLQFFPHDNEKIKITNGKYRKRDRNITESKKNRNITERKKNRRHNLLKNASTMYWIFSSIWNVLFNLKKFWSLPSLFPRKPKNNFYIFNSNSCFSNV